MRRRRKRTSSLVIGSVDPRWLSHDSDSLCYAPCYCIKNIFLGVDSQKRSSKINILEDAGYMNTSIFRKLIILYTRFTAGRHEVFSDNPSSHNVRESDKDGQLIPLRNSYSNIGLGTTWILRSAIHSSSLQFQVYAALLGISIRNFTHQKATDYHWLNMIRGRNDH